MDTSAEFCARADVDKVRRKMDYWCMTELHKGERPRRQENVNVWSAGADGVVDWTGLVRSDCRALCNTGNNYKK
jgi:hypothetical protein